MSTPECYTQGREPGVLLPPASYLEYNKYMQLSKEKTDKYDKAIKDSSIDGEIKAGKLTKEEKVELKSYAICKALKKKKYVRN